MIWQGTGYLLISRCAAGRCVVTTTDQITGEVGSQPLKMLRRRRFGKQLVFGQNMIPDGPGLIRAGTRSKSSKPRDFPVTLTGGYLTNRVLSARPPPADNQSKGGLSD
jgi:hypothetical protein